MRLSLSHQLGRIGREDLVDLARGASVLGTGGGGDPYIGRLMAEHAVLEHGPVDVVALGAVPDDAFVLPVAMMGAPAVMVEKIPAGGRTRRGDRGARRRARTRTTHVACIEAGGIKSMIPPAAAARAGLPLIDGDAMGRAFPELQMMLPTLDGVAATPMSLVDEKGNSLIIRSVDNRWGERLARPTTVEMGGSATMAIYPMTGALAKWELIPETYSLARRFGRRLADSRKEHVDPVTAAVDELAGLGRWSGHELSLDFQNEHLVAERDGETVASTPASSACSTPRRANP